MDKHGKTTEVAFETYSSRTSRVFADPGLKETILGVKGVTDCSEYAEIISGYNATIDPRYDRETVHQNIGAAIEKKKADDFLQTLRKELAASLEKELQLGTWRGFSGQAYFKNTLKPMEDMFWGLAKGEGTTRIGKYIYAPGQKCIASVEPVEWADNIIRITMDWGLEMTVSKVPGITRIGDRDPFDGTHLAWVDPRFERDIVVNSVYTAIYEHCIEHGNS